MNAMVTRLSQEITDFEGRQATWANDRADIAASVRFATTCALRLFVVSMQENTKVVISNLDENLGQIIVGKRVNGLTEN